MSGTSQLCRKLQGSKLSHHGMNFQKKFQTFQEGYRIANFGGKSLAISFSVFWVTRTIYFIRVFLDNVCRMQYFLVIFLSSHFQQLQKVSGLRTPTPAIRERSQFSYSRTLLSQLLQGCVASHLSFFFEVMLDFEIGVQITPTSSSLLL